MPATEGKVYTALSDKLGTWYFIPADSNNLFPVTVTVSPLGHNKH